MPGLLELADVAAALGRMDEVVADEARCTHHPPLSEHTSLAAATLILSGRHGLTIVLCAAHIAP